MNAPSAPDGTAIATNLHHTDRSSARHGVDRGRTDSSAAVIRLLERLGP
ncbi:hypothetical protein [Streptomyces sp. GbtcB6]|nr:hypothetical protein [Streptomyces sp. GbtcB6]